MAKKALILSLAVLAALAVYYFLPEEKLPKGIKVDRLVVYKSKRSMLAYSGGRVVKQYTISLGGSPVGDKQYEGDKRTPEGSYTILDKNPRHRFHKYLHISYPNKQDIREAKQAGRNPGGEILIHGLQDRYSFLGKFHRWYDWTLGCIALTDEELDDLYRAVDIGTPIDINP